MSSTIGKIINLELLRHFFDNLKTYISESDVANRKDITYSELVALRTKEELVPGMEYRITDFVTTVNNNSGMFASAGHPFDVIVTANSNRALNEDAKAALREGDTYFANCDINSWELKYCLDNDPNMFEWADPNGRGTGVIYYMKDDLGNECSYDFKNIMMLDREISTMFHTFTAKPGQDASVVFIGTGNEPRNNVIRDLHARTPAGNIQLLNYILFRGGFPCNDNYIDENCNNIFFNGSNCNKNIIGTNCSGISFLNDCSNNELGNDCSNISFGNSCIQNTLGNSCVLNTFVEECAFNTFGTGCSNNEFGPGFANNKFGDNCSINTFGRDCHHNTFGNECGKNIIANNSSYNVFGNNCVANRFGEYCSNNELGNGCTSIIMEYGCLNNTFGNNCYNIIFNSLAAPELYGSYYRFNKFGQGCNNITLDSMDIIRPGEITPDRIKPDMWVQNYNFINDLNIGSVISIAAERGLMYETKIARDTNNKVRIYTDFDSTSASNTTNVTYIELLALKKTSTLTPGMQYRITDFVTTSAQPGTTSAGHPFDVIVTAISNNVLNENAKAALHYIDDVTPDPYFTNCNINSWELKYYLENDYANFAWADTNGTGVIYYMKDEFGNECSYDFKNIMFKNQLDPSDDTWYYTFTGPDGGDLSVFGDSCYENKIKGYYIGLQLNLNNIIFNCINGRNLKIYNNTFEINCYNNIFGDGCYNNIFGDGCYNNTFGNICTNNTFGSSCSNNIVGVFDSMGDTGESCIGNVFGNNCENNTLYSNCSYNSFGESCKNNLFEGYCSHNVFSDNCAGNIIGLGCNNNVFGKKFGAGKIGPNRLGMNCSYNQFADECDGNILGDYCSNNVFNGEYSNMNRIGNYCSNNIFQYSQNCVLGDSCSNNNKLSFGCKFGKSCSNNTFGDNCPDNNFGDNCSGNMFGDNCPDNTFGDNCSGNTFGKSCSNNTFGDNCIYNTFGNNCGAIRFSTISGDKNCYFKNLNFEDGCLGMTIIEDTPYDAVSPLYAQDYVFMKSASDFVNGNIQNYTVKRGLTHSITVERDSYGQVKEYCKADTRNAYNIVNVDTQGALTHNIEIKPNTMYVIPEIQQLAITYENIPDTVVKEYVFQFISGSVETTLIMPTSTIWANGSIPVIKPYTIYQISILNDCATVLEFPMP